MTMKEILRITKKAAMAFLSLVKTQVGTAWPRLVLEQKTGAVSLYRLAR
jgi:hypothetical protein